jgi:UDP-glucuronate 4-epimerase
MTVLVTGAAGFVGLNLVEALLTRGESVVGLDLRPPPEPALALFRTLPGRFTPLVGDVTDAACLDRAFAAAGPGAVLVQMAAVTAGDARERSDPGLVARVNLGGTIEALAAAARHRARRVVVLSSVSVYGSNPPPAPTVDEVLAPPAPENLYAITKLAAERAGLRLAAMHGIPAVAVRLGSVWGPWEHDSGLRDTLSPLHAILTQAASGTEVILPPLYRDRARIDWTYARDAGEGLATLLAAPAFPHPVCNLGSGRSVTPVAMCEALARALPGFGWRFAAEGEEPTVPARNPIVRPPLALDRIRETCGWQPRFADPDSAIADWLATVSG